jgi:voltage-gated potassium channel
MQRGLRIKSSPPGLLRRASPFSVWVQIGIRLALLFGLLIFIIAVHWLERDSFRDNYDGQISFADVIYFTMISATTTGYGDIVPVTERARLFDALVVTPVRIFFILILAGTAYTFVIKRSWDKWIMKRLQKRLSNHIIVAGFGTSGSEAVAELLQRGIAPHRIVVLDPNVDALARAESLGCVVIQADGTRDACLEAIRIGTARQMIVSAGRDDTSILITLTARHLAPDLPISVVVRAADNEFPARAAGATTVINPVSFAGLLLAGSVDGQGIADYMTDLASATGGVRLHEREIERFEIGKSLQEVAVGIGLRVQRGKESIGFWEEGADRLELGDRITEVIPEHLFPKVPAA